jgi:FtsP/CotA-like multicopper oxidase with cupredoxin domain
MAAGARLSRRSLLAAGGGTVLASILRPRLVPAGLSSQKMLVAAEGWVRITPEPYPQTGVWCYDGSMPGPEIRLRQGDALRVAVENRLLQDTTVLAWPAYSERDGRRALCDPGTDPAGGALRL